jgi:hypothetical protein
MEHAVGSSIAAVAATVEFSLLLSLSGTGVLSAVFAVSTICACHCGGSLSQPYPCIEGAFAARLLASISESSGV